MKSTEIYQTKRTFINQKEKLTEGLPKPRQHFYGDLIYGIAKSGSVLLSNIARALEEDTALTYSIKRLSRNAAENHDLDLIHHNYLNAVKTVIPDQSLILVDGSDIAKPYAEKMEALGNVHDGSQNKIEKGYPTVNFSIATPKTKHPLPIYHRVCSSKEEGFESMNVETAKGFNQVDSLIDKKECTFVMDRGYDSNAMFQYIHNLDRFFITRLNDNRYLMHKNRRIKVPDIANRRKGKINFSTKIQGTTYALKVSHVKVQLPILKNTPLYMVIVYGYGKKPMKLLTNHEIKGKNDVLRILKGYITRWRIEELFRVQKQEFHLEEIRTMSLSSLRILYSMVNMIIGQYSLAIEKNNQLTQRIIARARSSNALSKITFYLYRFIRGVGKILSFDTTGIKYFHSIERRSNQLTLW